MKNNLISLIFIEKTLGIQDIVYHIYIYIDK